MEKARKPKKLEVIFGLEYRFFVVEADRSTEPAATANYGRKSFVRSLLQYQLYVEGELYKDHLKLAAPLMVLNVSNNQKRMEKILEVTGKQFPDGNSYLLFQHWENFGEVFIPLTVNDGLLHGNWGRLCARVIF